MVSSLFSISPARLFFVCSLSRSSLDNRLISAALLSSSFPSAACSWSSAGAASRATVRV